MSVYRITKDKDKEKFELLEMTSFEEQGLRERSDIQRLLRDEPAVLEKGLFILSEEYSSWEDSSRRIDLLALDGEGRLVVVELKRSDQQSMMDLQAIRYAAMVANMTWDRVVAAHQEYLESRQIDDDAYSRIRVHLNVEGPETRISTRSPRIILVSAEFSKELTHSVLWLNDRDLDITCVKLQPYKSGDDLFFERSQVIPPPEAKDFQVRWRDREREVERRGVSPVESYTGEAALAKFRDAIETLDSADQKNMLGQVCDMAEGLAADELAELRTNAGIANTVFRMELPGWDRSLVYGYRKGGVGYLRLIGGSFDSRAPTAKEKIEEIVGNLGRSRVLHNLPDGLLECLAEAYEEANGVSS